MDQDKGKQKPSWVTTISFLSVKMEKKQKQPAGLHVP